MILQIYIFGAITVCLWTFFFNSRSRRNLPPGPSPILPIIGNIPQLIQYRAETSYETFDKIAQDYGPIVFIQFGKMSHVIVQDFRVAKEILCSDIWVNRYFDEMIAERSYGKQLGLIFATGDAWKEMRKFTIRTLRDFGFGKQLSMETVIDLEVAIIITRLEKSVDQGRSLSMKQFFSLSILNILWAMVAGVRFNHDDSRLLELIYLVDETSKANPIKATLIQAFPILWKLAKHTPKAGRRRNFIRKLQQYFVEMLKVRRESGSYHGEPKDFIDAFLQEIELNKREDGKHSHYTDEQFILVCFDLFVAAAETTSNTLEFAMLYMILNPRVQEKVQAEIDFAIGNTRGPSLLDKSRMPYTEATILEVQRMANVLPVIIRSSIQDTELAGYHIPKGTLACLNTHSLHLNKDTWGDPMNFRPERFLDSGNNVINAHKILAFGLGKRVCLGEALARASLFSYFTSILQKYTFKPSLNHGGPSMKPVYGFTLSPEEYFVNVQQR